MNRQTFFTVATVLISAWLSVWTVRAEIVTSDVDVCAPRPTQFTMPIENRQYFPSPKNDSDHELIFGVLLPQQPEKFGPLCALGATVAAIELAIKNSQQPGGLLEDYSITVAYIDTETSSTLAAFAAFQLYTKRPPGYYHPLSSILILFCTILLPFWLPVNAHAIIRRHPH